METLAPEATADMDGLSSESTSNHISAPAASEDPSSGQLAPSLSASTEDVEQDYDDSDFAAALANFDREQAAETAAAQSLTAEEVVVTGTVVKITDKHVGGRHRPEVRRPDSAGPGAGLTPARRSSQPATSIEVVVEREESTRAATSSRTRRRCATRCGTSWKKPPTPRLPSRAWWFRASRAA